MPAVAPPGSPAAIGLCFDRTLPAPLIREFAQQLDRGGADDLWIIEDCFYTGGVSLAATALAVTDRLTVGFGILPAVARAVPVTAMEIATLSALAPGRVLAGIGHGVQSWMGQMGVRTRSPLTTLEEVFVTLRRLLAGEEVTFDGRQISLDSVRLDAPPQELPPLLAGVQGPRSMELAGRIADGVVLAEPASPSYVRWSLDKAGREPGDFVVATFSQFCVKPTRESAYAELAPWLATQLRAPGDAYRALPFFDDLTDWYARHGADGLRRMPTQWWQEIGPIGTLDDALAHVEALQTAGARRIGFFPRADVAAAREQVEHVIRIAQR